MNSTTMNRELMKARFSSSRVRFGVHRSFRMMSEDEESTISPLAVNASTASTTTAMPSSSSSQGAPLRGDAPQGGPPLKGSAVHVQGVGRYDFPFPHRTRRSQSAPVLSASYPDFSMESASKEANFLKIGDRVAFFSEKDDCHGFVSTLG